MFLSGPGLAVAKEQILWQILFNLPGHVINYSKDMGGEAQNL